MEFLLRTKAMTTCDACTRDRTIALIAGDTVCSYCPSWASECLFREKSARVVLSIGSVTGRQAWLQDYERHNGPAAAERLRNVVKRMWGER